MSPIWKLKEIIWRRRGIREAKRIDTELNRLLEQRGRLPEGHFRIGVYFADDTTNLYQMRQWYDPLRYLDETHPVLVVTRKPSGANALIQESGLNVAYAPTIDDIEELLSLQKLDVMLYVNQNTLNFQMMRYGSVWHVFISHGESDKAYMVSNQLKAYDYSFIAGEAARERLKKTLRNYDVDARTVAIGRPQTDYLTGNAPYPDDDRIVVFYAPTWEGDRASMSYGSLVTHGETLVKRLLETGRHRVVYRPHPRTGVNEFSQRLANRNIKRMLIEANRKDPSAHHIYDQSSTLGWQLSQTDIMICDISAMIYDRLATGRPLMVTRPASLEAEIDLSGYLSACEWLDATDTLRIAEVLDNILSDRNAHERLVTWVEYYFGDESSGKPTNRFRNAIELLLQDSVRSSSEYS